MKTHTISHDKIPETYADMTALVMPRPLHDEVDYRNALEVMEALAGFEMNPDQEDYFEAISIFVEKYEAEHHAIEMQGLTAVEILHGMMDEHGMSESDLGRLLGDRSLGYRILTGERDISKTHIRKLAEHFAVSPALFLDA